MYIFSDRLSVARDPKDLPPKSSVYDYFDRDHMTAHWNNPPRAL